MLREIDGGWLGCVVDVERMREFEREIVVIDGEGRFRGRELSWV